MIYEVIDRNGTIHLMDRAELQVLFSAETGLIWEGEASAILELWEHGIAVRGAYA